MADETTRLITEIVTEQVAAASAKMEGDYRRAVQGMDAETKRAQTSVDGLGAKIQGISRFAVTAGRGLSAGIGAATAAAAGAERSWVGLGTSILASFAAGGPVAGGLALVGGLIGMVAGKTKEAAEAAAKAEADFKSFLKDAKERADAARKSMEDFARATAAAQFGRVGIGLDKQRLDLLEEGRALTERRDRERAFFESLGSREEIIRSAIDKKGVRGDWQDTANRWLRNREQAKAALEATSAELAAVESKLRDLKTAADAVAGTALAESLEKDAEAARKAANELRYEVHVLKQRTDLEREIAQARVEREKALGDPKADRALIEERFQLRIKQALAAEVKRYQSDIDKQGRESAKWWDDFAKAVEEAAKAERELLESSDKFLKGLKGQLAVASAATQEEKDRLEAENAIREALDAGTLALWDAEEAYQVLLDLAKKRREEESKTATLQAQAAARALNRDAASIELSNRLGGPIGAAQIDLIRMQGEATRTFNAEARYALEQRIAARERELAQLEAQRTKEEAILELEQKLAELRDPTKHAGAPIDPAAIARFEAARRSQIEAAYAQSIAVATAQGIASAQPYVDEAMRGLLQSIQGTLGQGLTDLIMDGITNGFRNAEQIALGIVRSMLSQVLNSLINSGIQAAFGGLFGSPFGGSGQGIFGAAAGLFGSGGGALGPAAGALAPIGTALGGGAAPC